MTETMKQFGDAQKQFMEMFTQTMGRVSKILPFLQPSHHLASTPPP